MERLDLSSVQAANVEYRLLPEYTMIDALDDFVAVYEHMLNHHDVDPSKVVFTGCSGGGSMALYTYMYLRNTDRSTLYYIYIYICVCMYVSSS